MTEIIYHLQFKTKSFTFLYQPLVFTNQIQHDIVIVLRNFIHSKVLDIQKELQIRCFQ